MWHCNICMLLQSTCKYCWCINYVFLDLKGGNKKMKMKILCVFVPCLYILSSAFCSDMFVSPNGTNVHNSALLYCTSKNMQRFGYSTSVFDKPYIEFWKRNNISISYTEYMKMIDFNLASKKLFKWYYILNLCRSFYVLDKNYYTLFDEISYERLPDNCKKLLSENITELREKCDVSGAQKLSLLTAINVSWEDVLSVMKEIALVGALSHKYTLTEALFILHLKPSQSCTSTSIWSNWSKLFQKDNEYKEEDVLFYAECLTGALARVLKYEKKIPDNFEFDLLQTNDLSWRFIKNAKKLMQAYKDYFIREQNRMNRINNNKDKIERGKKKTYNLLQEEEKCKLKQD